MRIVRENWERSWVPFLWRRWWRALTDSTGSQFIEGYEYRWSFRLPNLPTGAPTDE